ncbi:MAG TPA: type II toxin-antitoxin system VapC family toxin [Candidatus Acidoferrales bacterium]|nr:type II toxin-antitoxin system VapC family toxin [Candidatus Acidoferrales bacterium]
MLLDTCALLWLVEGERIRRPVLKLMEAAPSLCLSAISAFEVAFQVHSGKLILSDPVMVWLNAAAAHHGISIVPLDLDICVKAAGLPPMHSDPCDRFIIATALLRDLPVVTADERFAAYGVQTIF